jgi:hypothetical protein
MKQCVVVLAAVAFLSLPLLPSSGAEPAAEKDPWVGSYLLYDAEKGRPVPDRPMTITKIGDRYAVSGLEGYKFAEVGKAWLADMGLDRYRFAEAGKTVLADKKNAVGISVVSVPSTDGGRKTVLLVDSCYGPTFHLIRRVQDSPDDPVEKALTTYCDKLKLARDKLKPYELDLVPGTKVFRYQLPAVPAPAKEPWMRLGVRFAFVFVESKTGRLFECKRTSYESPAPCRPVVEAMKKAGRKVTTDKEATTVMRDLVILDGFLWYVDFEPSRAKAIEAHGQYRKRPNTFFGGIMNWQGGDDVGLEVDKEGYVTNLLGGHVR